MSQFEVSDSCLEVSIGPQVFFLAYSIMLGIASFAFIAIAVDQKSIWGGVVGLCTFGLSVVLLRFFLINQKWRIDLDNGEMYLVEGLPFSNRKTIRKCNIRQFTKAFYALTLNRESVVYTVTVSDIRGKAMSIASELGEQSAKELVEILCNKFALTNLGYVGL
jgi:hypothetical protein